jgi:hypothetical protein
LINPLPKPKPKEYIAEIKKDNPIPSKVPRAKAKLKITPNINDNFMHKRTPFLKSLRVYTSLFIIILWFYEILCELLKLDIKI